MSKILIECVPNFSEGQDSKIINAIADKIKSVLGVTLLDVDPGKDTNRTVMTFVGHPDAVVEAAFLAIQEAALLIDMSKHKGAHPRMGATDVCPLIPISGISLEETAVYAIKLGEKVGSELNIPVYLYEAAAASLERSNLSEIRSGEYEGFQTKILEPKWKPDFGPIAFNLKSGATVIGARDFLVAYNVNLNTTSVKKANSIAFDIRENGRTLKIKGENVLDENNQPKRTLGKLKSIKAIGWYIQEYGFAQISMNLTNINISSVHEAFEACRESAEERGIKVTGSELIGMIPKKVLIDAGKYFLRKQRSSEGISENEIIRIAVRSLGLEELGKFDPQKKIIEYAISQDKDQELVHLNLKEFANKTASDSPAPGGGSVSAYVGSLGASLCAMVANLSIIKKGYEKKYKLFNNVALKAQEIKQELLVLVDEDTKAFNDILFAIRLPKTTNEEIVGREKAIHAATIQAIEVPLKVMKISAKAIPLLEKMVDEGNPNSISDAAVGISCIKTAICGAHFNVKINLKDLSDKKYKEKTLQEANQLFYESCHSIENILNKVEKIF